MTKSQTENTYVEQPKRVTQRIVEAPVTYELIQRDTESHVREDSRANSKLIRQAVETLPLLRPHGDNLLLPSEHPHYSSHSVTRSPAEVVTCPPYVNKISVADSEKSRDSHTSLHDKTARQSDFISITEVKSPKDVPLPRSRVTSLATERREDSQAGKSSVSPKESVSQVSTRRSGRSSEKMHYSSHDLGSGEDHEHRDHESRTSRK